jgi:hypothetical protein
MPTIFGMKDQNRTQRRVVNVEIVYFIGKSGRSGRSADRCVKIWVEDIEEGPTLCLRPGQGMD